LTIDYLVRQVAINRQINVTLLRLFNSIGPEQNESFVVSSFAKQLALIKLEKQDPVIYVGNLEASRDFMDVRDAVRAMFMVAHSEEFGEYYNVCAGKAYKIYDVLNLLISISGLKVDVVNDPERMRPSDVPIFVGDYSKINKKYGWQPMIPLEQSLSDTYQYWLEVLNV
jgi:GDP-4-dehydro-6-deoxy-D-mannose reductase